MTGLSRLPIPVRPAHHEILASYIARLAAVHALPYRQLWACLSVATGPSARLVIVPERLAAATGHPLPALEQALPELRDPAPDWQQLRHLPQPACPSCTGRHPGGQVKRLYAHHEYVCSRHGYWIGPAHPGLIRRPPRRLAVLIPDLVTAQHQHDRLVHRHGWQPVFDAVQAATTACIDHQVGDWPCYRDTWRARLTRLIPKPSDFDTAIYLAAFYPEIIQHAAALCASARPTGQVYVTPALTYPATRRTGTIDGTESGPSRAELKLAAKAFHEYRRHRHAPAWSLPHTTRHHRDPIPRPGTAVNRAGS